MPAICPSKIQRTGVVSRSPATLAAGPAGTRLSPSTVISPRSRRVATPACSSGAPAAWSSLKRLWHFSAPGVPARATSAMSSCSVMGRGASSWIVTTALGSTSLGSYSKGSRPSGEPAPHLLGAVGYGIDEILPRRRPRHPPSSWRRPPPFRRPIRSRGWRQAVPAPPQVIPATAKKGPAPGMKLPAARTAETPPSIAIPVLPVSMPCATWSAPVTMPRPPESEHGRAIEELGSAHITDPRHLRVLRAEPRPVRELRKESALGHGGQQVVRVQPRAGHGGVGAPPPLPAPGSPIPEILAPARDKAGCWDNLEQ